MSTQSGKNKGRAGKGPGDSAGGKPKKTVAASAAKPGRDETTVEIDSAEETKVDLPRVEPDGEGGEKDGAAAKGKAGTKAGSGTGKDGESASPEIAPVKDPADADWAKPAEPADSVSARRVEPETAKKPATGSSAASGAAAGPGPARPAQAPQPGGPLPGSGSGPTFAEAPAASPTSPTSQASPTSPTSPAGFAKAMLKNRTAARTPSASGKGARKAQLQLARLEPWSVMKFSFVMSLVCFVVLLVAVIVLYGILSGLGVFSTIGDTVNDLTRNPGETSGGLDAGSWFSFFRVFGYTILVGALNVLLITALSTVGSVIYNLAADLVGGIEVTLKEAD
ncbi:DUF3566 domain-containing protein [Spirillospora sp. NPDC029432]|uniref:DUF3566 domain-containing protein n=1 Tax=Spirillospora sp. NPDC029432 TaxID=3154599 RepID=UPI003454BC06